MRFLESIPEEYLDFTRLAEGIDVVTISQRAVDAQVEEWRICSAVWAILLSRHTSHAVQTIPIASRSLPQRSGDLKFPSYATVHATVGHENSFAEQVLDCKLSSGRDEAIASISTLLCLDFATAGDGREAADFRTPCGTDLTVRLLSTKTGSLYAQCQRRASFHRALAEKLIEHYLQMLGHVLRHSNWSLLRIEEIPMLSLQAEFELRQECLPQRSAADIECCSTHQLFRRQAAKTPNRYALEGPDGMRATYRELDVMTDVIAEELRTRLRSHTPPTIDTGLFVGAATIVGIMLQRSPAVIFAILASWKAGYAFVLLDPSQPIARNRQILDICQCPLVMVEPRGAGDDDIGRELAFPFSVDFGRNSDKDGTKQRPETSDIDLTQSLLRPAWIKTTSGSTGKPKCAVHSHAALGSSIASYAGRTRGSRTLLFFNPVSAASGIPIWTFLTNGGCICIPTQDEINHDLAGSIVRYRADHICILPSAIALIKPEQVPNLRSIAFAGESTPKALAEMWSRHASLLIGYGATEMNSHALPYHDELHGALPPAQTLPNSDYSLYILRPGTKSLCPLFVPGEICVSTTHMSYGYLGMNQTTAKVFVPHPFPGDAGHHTIYRTGDLGMRIGSGLFVVLGRIDFVFKIDGNRISPEEIESVVRSVHEVERVKVLLVTSPAQPAILTCCLVLREGGNWAHVQPLIQEATRHRLPTYMIPHRFLQLEAFPVTPASKIDTTALMELAKERLESDGKHRHTFDNSLANGHMSRKGERFLDIALRVLAGGEPHKLSQHQRERMQTQSFLANGGSSLLVLQLLTKLRSEGLDMDLSALYGEASLLQVASTFPEADQSTETRESAHEQHPPRALLDSLLHRLPKDMPTGSGAYQAILPVTMLQREMFAFALVDPKPWLVYQFLDLSKEECTFSQIQEAIGLLVSSKSNLRTVFGLLDVQQHPPAPQNIDAAYDLMQKHTVVQAILNHEALAVSILNNDEIDDCRAFWKQDSRKSWAFGQPLWRLSWLSKRRVLAWTFHHAIVDEWIGRNISRDLYAVMAGIQDRDRGNIEWRETLTRACDAAAKPSIEEWIISQYGNALNHSPSRILEQQSKIWEEYMAGAVGTPIPDDALLPAEELPAPPREAVLTNLPYGEWCQRHHVTSSALFHVVNALTIARVLQLWPPGGTQQAPATDITFYRISSNRAATREAWEAEGVLLSISPMRVKFDAAMTPATLVRETLQQWIKTQSADPYYEDGRPTIDPCDPLRRRRPWGNVCFNYGANRDEVDTEPSSPEAFPQAVRREDTAACYAAVWPLGVLEMNVFESNPAAGDRLELAVVSNLRSHKAEEFLYLFRQMLLLVLDASSDANIGVIMQQCKGSS